MKVCVTGHYFKILLATLGAVMMLAFAILFGEIFKENTIAKLSYSKNKTIDNLVYLLEDNVYVPFLVLCSDSNGNTLLLRRDVLEQPMQISDYFSYYENCVIDNYLNKEYIEKLEQAKDYIVSSNINIVFENSLGRAGNDIKQINRKIFILSYSEVFGKKDANGVYEDKGIDYFKTTENRVAKVNGKNASWWLRTPNSYYNSCSYVIGSNSKIGCINCYDECGVRPAFYVKSDTKVKKVNLKGIGEKYVISE